DLSRFPVAANCTRGLAKGTGLPSSRSKRGFGSNVSTCDGPPAMKRKMIRLARGGKCGGLGDSGSTAASARHSSANSDARASEPKPTAARWSIPRLDIASGTMFAGMTFAPQAHFGRALFDIDELVGGKGRLAEARPGLV